MLITEVSFKIVPAPIFRLRLYLDFIKAQLCIDKNCGLFIGIVEPALVVFVTERTLKELWMNEQERRRCPKYIIYIYIVITTLEICTRTKYIYIYTYDDVKHYIRITVCAYQLRIREYCQIPLQQLVLLWIFWWHVLS